MIALMWIFAIGIWVFFIGTVIKDKIQEGEDRREAARRDMEYRYKNSGK